MDEEQKELFDMPLYERNKMRFCPGFDLDKFIDIIDKTPFQKRDKMLRAFYKTIKAKGRFLDEKNPASKFAFEMILKTSKYMKATRQKAANMAATRWNNGTPGAPPDTTEEENEDDELPF